MTDPRRIHFAHAETIRDPRVPYPKNYHPSAPAVIIEAPTPADFEAVEATYGHPGPNGLWEHWPERNVIVIWADKLAVTSVKRALQDYGVALESGQVRHAFRKATYLRRDREGTVVGQEEVDPATIYALLDEHGKTPKPPAPAYMQKLFGVPVGYFTVDELLAVPYDTSEASHGPV